VIVKRRYKYVHDDVDRHGNVRVLFRRRIGNKKVRIRERIGTPEFDRRYEELVKAGRSRSVQAGAEHRPEAPHLPMAWHQVVQLGTVHPP
jgi:hypothetical protein